tara:strand:+ start:31 stop:1188 length:1158 start_codon:yes stop_codon:yes gene_type:complete
MPKVRLLRVQLAKGFTLIEVLVTLVITAIALLGVIELQNRTQIANLETTQRAYATMIASNMAEQIKANPGIGADCNLTASFDVGSGHGTWDHPCDSGGNSVKEWHKDLIGTREQISDAKIGSIKNGHGCINYTAAVPATGTPAKYTVSVAWKGFQKTAAGGTSGSCGFGEYGDSGYHRLVSLDVYPQSLPMACSQPPQETLPGVVITQNYVGQPSRILTSGQVLLVTGAGNYNGSLTVRSGAHVVVSGSVGINGSVTIDSGGHYWKTSTTGFTGSLSMNGTEHVEPAGCNWFPLPSCGVSAGTCSNGGTFNGHDSRTNSQCFNGSVNWTTHPHMSSNTTLTVLGDVSIGDCGGGFSHGGGTIRYSGANTSSCAMPSSVTTVRCTQ